jgi:hypothetical protein
MIKCPEILTFMQKLCFKNPTLADRMLFDRIIRDK